MSGRVNRGHGATVGGGTQVRYVRWVTCGTMVLGYTVGLTLI
uniref:Bm8088 n=1 Tax=Brugia malayi TaxID=6279 RepID=A0A1I9G7R2_BRUMA|nr:Bm8088 [Brugia malayi]